MLAILPTPASVVNHSNESRVPNLRPNVALTGPDNSKRSVAVGRSGSMQGWARGADSTPDLQHNCDRAPGSLQFADYPRNADTLEQAGGSTAYPAGTDAHRLVCVQALTSQHVAASRLPQHTRTIHPSAPASTDRSANTPAAPAALLNSGIPASAFRDRAPAPHIVQRADPVDSSCLAGVVAGPAQAGGFTASAGPRAWTRATSGLTPNDCVEQPDTSKRSAAGGRSAPTHG